MVREYCRKVATKPKMSVFLRSGSLRSMGLAAWALLAYAGPVPGASRGRPDPVQTIQSLTGFLPECGDKAPERGYTFQSRGLQVRIWRNQLVYRLQKAEVSLTFEGANVGVEGSPELRLTGVVNVVLPGAVSGCQGLPRYGRLALQDLYPGITLQLDAEGEWLKPDYLVDAGADPASIRLRQTGASSMKVGANGDLELRTTGGILRERRPKAWQWRNGKQEPASASWEVHEDGSAGFMLGHYDHELPLVIDPVVSYNTYLANASSTSVSAATSTAVDAAGNVYYAGWIEGSNLGVQSLTSPSGSVDAFLLKLNPAGSILFATYFGGSGDDRALGVTVDSAGQPWITGVTASRDLPVMNAFQAAPGGYRNAFIAEFSVSGALLFASYFGGTGPDSGNGIAADASGNVYVVGDTNSATLLLLQPEQRIYGGGQDAFVAKLNKSGGLVYSTYLGGSFSDHGAAIATDSAGNAYVTGGTYSTNFPVKGAFQGTIKGSADAFATKLDPNGALVYSTYLGGSGGSQSSQEQGNAITVDTQGDAIIAGMASSSDFPYPAGGPRPVLSGPSDAFIVKLAASGNALLSSVFLGGIGVDVATGIAVDRFGAVCVVGYSSSGDFPVTAPLQTNHAGIYDAFIRIYNPAGTALFFSTLIGGTGIDAANGVALDSVGNVYVAGQTGSLDYPLVNAIPRTHSNGLDAFGLKIASDDAYTFVERLYFGVLYSTPDPSGLASWTNILNQGSQTRAQVALSFFQLPAVQNSGFYVIAAYISVLGRDPDYSGFLYWTSLYRSGVLVPSGCGLGAPVCSQQQLLLDFMQSPEFQVRFTAVTSADFVTVVYQNVLGRSPDGPGAAFWLGSLNAGLSRPQMVASFVTSPEFLSSFGPRIQTQMAYVAFLLRTATPVELQTWATALNGGATVASLVNTLISSPEFKSGL